MYKPRFGLMALFFALLFGTLLFAGGFFAGTHYRPEIERVTGLFNTETSVSTSTPDAEGLASCLDANGASVPCLLERDGVSAKDDSPADFGQFWTAWNIINERYVPPKSKVVTNQEKVYGAIQGLAGSLDDPYTFFLPPQEKTLFEGDVSGSFGGVGMQIGMKDNALTVIAPLKGSPAERAGIMKGDKVLRIDGATTSDMTIDKALYLIRGEIGKSVTLTLWREGDESKKEPFDVTIIREAIQVPTVDTEQKGDVFIIRLYGFPATGAELFRGALREFVQSGTDKLVLDLRGNPGGYLEVAVDMASWFLPQGKVVVSEEGRQGVGQVFRSKGYNVFGDKFHFVILVDSGSASASEILAGALAQHGVATLVGQKTFGKGSVQELVPISDTASLKLTIARWVTPNGTNLSEGGLSPDVEVGITKEDVESGEDPQLKKAIEVVRKGAAAYKVEP
ncbi:MAG: S41 family peptidase [bacterium]|nr:S41 family peptidase [bacterium]